MGYLEFLVYFCGNTCISSFRLWSFKVHHYSNGSIDTPYSSGSSKNTKSSVISGSSVICYNSDSSAILHMTFDLLELSFCSECRGVATFVALARHAWVNVAKKICCWRSLHVENTQSLRNIVVERTKQFKKLSIFTNSIFTISLSLLFDWLNDWLG